jgi:hypothetical protein
MCVWLVLAYQGGPIGSARAHFKILFLRDYVFFILLSPVQNWSNFLLLDTRFLKQIYIVDINQQSKDHPHNVIS